MMDATALKVDPGNAEQARAWDGDEGAYWAGNAEHFDRAVAAHHDRFMSAAGISGSDRVLDVGCGTGQTTRDAARTAQSGFAHGVDLSARMVGYARHAAARQGVANAGFEQADAQVHRFTPASFDIAISRTGAMFFGDPIAAFTNIAAALRPAGRLVLLTWQGPASNEWICELSGAFAVDRQMPQPPLGAPGPFGLSEPDRVERILGAAGFTGIDLKACTEPMWFGRDAADAHRFVLGMLGWMLDGLDKRGRDRALENLRATLTAHDTGQGVFYQSAAWTIEAIRHDRLTDSEDGDR